MSHAFLPNRASITKHMHSWSWEPQGSHTKNTSLCTRNSLIIRASRLLIENRFCNRLPCEWSVRFFVIHSNIRPSGWGRGLSPTEGITPIAKIRWDVIKLKPSISVIEPRSGVLPDWRYCYHISRPSTEDHIEFLKSSPTITCNNVFHLFVDTCRE